MIFDEQGQVSHGFCRVMTFDVQIHDKKGNCRCRLLMLGEMFLYHNLVF